MKLRTMLFAFVAVLTAWNCSTEGSEQYCNYTTNTGIDEVTGPETTTVDVPIELEAEFKISNGCGQFLRFIESNGYPKTIYAQVSYVGCVCTEILQIATETYTFQASAPGEYELRFVKPDETYIVKTITVTE